VALNYHDTYIQSWNVSVQRDLPGRLVESFSTWVEDDHLDVPTAPNQAALESSLTAEQRLPIANAGVSLSTSRSVTRLMKERKRASPGASSGSFRESALYVFKAIDDAVLAQNFYDQSAEKALSTFDHRQVLTLNWVLASRWTPPRVPVAPGVDREGAQGLDRIRRHYRADRRAADSDRRRNLDGLLPLPRCAPMHGPPTKFWFGYFNPAAFTITPAGEYGNAAAIPLPALDVLAQSVARA